MNNIEILEKLKDEQYDKETLKTICVFYDEDFKPYVLSTEEREALENLIKEYKELKEKISKYEKQLDLDYVEENYIPKSKVKEKIEEIKRNDYSSYDTCLCFQELLEEGE